MSAVGDWPEIVGAIEATGLAARGVITLAPAERVGALEDVACLALLGFVGRRGFDVFAASPEAADGAEHPLDRWSRRVIDALAAELGAKAFYPFGGPPYWPFQRWALHGDDVHASPIGLLIRADYGLWHSYRGALGFSRDIAPPARPKRERPCDTCPGRPCLTTCPVGAFRAGRYDVAACASWLQAPGGADCMNEGCRARRACPVGAEHRPTPAQAAFHMRAFLAARERR